MSVAELAEFTVPDADELLDESPGAPAGLAADEMAPAACEASADSLPRNDPASSDTAAAEPPPSQPGNDDCRLRAAREEFLQAAVKRSELEKQLKRAKKAEKEALEAYRLLAVGRQLELPLVAAPPLETQKTLLDAASEAGQVDGDWRRSPIGELNLKPAIETKLLENDIATIGQLEDLRAGAGLKSIKGVGQAKADAIEDAVLAWLSKHRDAEALSTSTPAGISQFDPDAEAAAKIEARAGELLLFENAAQAAGDGSDPLQPVCESDRYWNGGVEAFDRGVPVRDCPVEPAGPEQDDWLRGWLTANLAEEATG